MIRINGNIINRSITSGSGITILNGQVLINGTKTSFDERKLEDGSNIDRIVIDSTIPDINLSVSDSSKVEAHFYGEAQIDGDITIH